MDIGLDLGATLAKAVSAPPGEPLETFESELFAVGDLDALDRFLRERSVRGLAATGAGAHRLSERLGGSRHVWCVEEFEAWRIGEETLLRHADFVPTAPHLLVSLGTGTSILCVDSKGVSRVGGTALGGGTLQGLGQLLVNECDHDRLALLASLGSRTGVDLLVSDIYRPGEIGLDTELTASNFGRVESNRREDLAQSLTRLVAENVGLLAGALATRLAGTLSERPAGGLLDVVYAGSTLSRTETLKSILTFVTRLAGARARFLPQGEFVGALGALVKAREMAQ